MRHISLIVCLITLTLSAVLPFQSYGETVTVKAPGSKVLTAKVTYLIDEVSEAIFGQWHRTRYILESSDMRYFSPEDSGAWVIQRHGKQVQLMNPDTHAIATAEVIQVEGNTATFEYRNILPNGNFCYEQLTLTPEFNMLRGYQYKECYKPTKSKNGDPVRYFYAKAIVEGIKPNAETLSPLSHGFNVDFLKPLVNTTQ